MSLHTLFSWKHKLASDIIFTAAWYCSLSGFDDCSTLTGNCTFIVLKNCFVYLDLVKHYYFLLPCVDLIIEDGIISIKRPESSFRMNEQKNFETFFHTMSRFQHVTFLWWTHVYDSVFKKTFLENSILTFTAFKTKVIKYFPQQVLQLSKLIATFSRTVPVSMGTFSTFFIFFSFIFSTIDLFILKSDL